MGKAAEVASDGGAASRDGGARDARAVRRRGRAARSAAQHTAARRRVRAGRASTVTSPLSASRADEKQLPASPEQVRERRARVGGRRGGGRRAARQEGRAAAEGHALVGAHGRAARGAGPAALRHGAAPRRRRAAARRVTSPRQPRRDHITLTFHYRDGRTPRSARASRSIIDLVFIYSGAPARPARSAARARVPRAV